MIYTLICFLVIISISRIFFVADLLGGRWWVERRRWRPGGWGRVDGRAKPGSLFEWNQRRPFHRHPRRPRLVGGGELVVVDRGRYATNRHERGRRRWQSADRVPIRHWRLHSTHSAAPSHPEAGRVLRCGTGGRNSSGFRCWRMVLPTTGGCSSTSWTRHSASGFFSFDRQNFTNKICLCYDPESKQEYISQKWKSAFGKKKKKKKEVVERIKATQRRPQYLFLLQPTLVLLQTFSSPSSSSSRSSLFSTYIFHDYTRTHLLAPATHIRMQPSFHHPRAIFGSGSRQQPLSPLFTIPPLNSDGINIFFFFLYVRYCFIDWPTYKFFRRKKKKEFLEAVRESNDDPVIPFDACLWERLEKITRCTELLVFFRERETKL